MSENKKEPQLVEEVETSEKKELIKKLDILNNQMVLIIEILKQEIEYKRIFENIYLLICEGKITINQARLIVDLSPVELGDKYLLKL